MPDLIAALIPLLFLIAVLGIAVRGGPLGFRPRLADARFGSARGPLAATWLALVSATWGILELAGSGWFPLPASLVVTLIVGAVCGLVLAARTTLFLLAVAGLATQFGAIAHDEGPSAAVLVLLVTGLVTWLFGAVRGFAARR